MSAKTPAETADALRTVAAWLLLLPEEVPAPVIEGRGGADLGPILLWTFWGWDAERRFEEVAEVIGGDWTPNDTDTAYGEKFLELRQPGPGGYSLVLCRRRAEVAA